MQIEAVHNITTSQIIGAAIEVHRIPGARALSNLLTRRSVRMGAVASVLISVPLLLCVEVGLC
jgi:hypothetical protein